ncbi:hypothetical protein HRR83_006779 [Exophiala dermatitidis]|nr:hypothetical protein HRR75_005439 [Exophiala dermatitidis]KAJ4514280.1 hypothetical protein HRR74_005940 [Exophiala dermatitidis]KAJ4549664.1 hypothetical protein HRR78_005123 [Exophiala dermatitidis]KAJ4562637.1 hypothetical protein HRR81_008878 [Exophiala dermatitidis]KAJ4591690.1 hypothetical protein HRR84_007422 [Exophiala dermatitidis]
MAVIWGLDLHDIQWSKFKSSYMFGNKDYHLRRTKFVVYQIAMIFCVVSESVGTAALSGKSLLPALEEHHEEPMSLTKVLHAGADYVKQQSTIESLHSSASVHNDDFVGIASYNIFVGIAVATIFGAAFFFDLFFPERYEPRNIRWAWRISALVVTIMTLADALALTVIVATGNAWIAADSEDARLIAQERINPPLVYRHNGRAVASVVFVWIGLCGTIASCVVMWLYYRHLEIYGPKSHSARMRRMEDKTITDSPSIA